MTGETFFIPRHHFLISGDRFLIARLLSRSPCDRNLASRASRPMTVHAAVMSGHEVGYAGC
jgi:hypothetical protein